MPAKTPSPADLYRPRDAVRELCGRVGNAKSEACEDVARAAESYRVLVNRGASDCWRTACGLRLVTLQQAEAWLKAYTPGRRGPKPRKQPEPKGE